VGNKNVHASFSSGLTFVALSRVKPLDSIIIVDQVDYSRVQKLGGNQTAKRRAYTANV